MGWAELFFGKPRDVFHSSDLPAGLSSATAECQCHVLPGHFIQIFKSAQRLAVIAPAVSKYLFETVLQGVFMIRSY